MTDRELLQQALDALETMSKDVSDVTLPEKLAIEAIRTRLAQPDGVDGEVRVQIRMNDKWFRDRELETAIATNWVASTPPKKEWVGLTMQERDEINEKVYGAVPHYVVFHHAIEQALKEKNT